MQPGDPMGDGGALSGVAEPAMPVGGSFQFPGPHAHPTFMPTPPSSHPTFTPTPPSPHPTPPSRPSPGLAEPTGPSSPAPLPVPSIPSLLLEREARGLAAAAASPAPAPGLLWAPGTWGASSLSCSTEGAVALSQERAWGCGAVGGCGWEGLGAEAPGSMLPARKAMVRYMPGAQIRLPKLPAWGERQQRVHMGDLTHLPAAPPGKPPSQTSTQGQVVPQQL